jgi:L-iditol 2-dehydrogenase
MTDGTMRAARMVGTSRVEVVDTAIPTIREGEGEVVLRTRASSICGSDLHGLRSGGPDTHHHDPFVLGHESVGDVVASDDDAVPVGTRVLHVPLVEDGRTFAEFQIARREFVVPVPVGMSDDEAVVGQQLGTVLWALKNWVGSRSLPDVVVVIGAGPAGLLFLQVLRLSEVAVVVSEPGERRRSLARDLGAHAVVPDRLAETVSHLTGARGASLVIDAAGSTMARSAAIDAAARGATVGLFGLPDDDTASVDVATMFVKNLTVAATMNAQLEPNLESFRAALDLISSGRIAPTPLVSHRFALTDVDDAFRITSQVTDGAVKVIVYPNHPPMVESAGPDPTPPC